MPTQSRLLHQNLIVIITSRQLEEAGHKIVALVQEYALEVIAIGNGTASREIKAMVRGLDLPRAIPLVVVSEARASVYSASRRWSFPTWT